TAEAIESDAISQTRLDALRNKFGDSNTKAALDKINGYRPAKVLKGLKSDLEPVFKEGPKSKFLGRPTKTFEGFNYKGAFIEKTDPKFFHPIQNYKDKLRFAAEIDSILEADTRGANSLVRGRVLKSFLAERGIKLRWWEKMGSYYKNLKQEAAESLAQQQAYNANKTARSACALTEACDIADEVSEATDQIIKDAKDKTATELEEQVVETADKTLKNSVTKKLSSVLSVTSTVYAVAVPLCLIYDGSIENSQETIDNAEGSLLNTYMMVRTGADQIKSGETTAEAIGGLDGKIGDIDDSIPQRRANGDNIDSATEIASYALPQASTTGTYSLLNVTLSGYMPDSVLSNLNDYAQNGCKVITDWRTGVTLTAAEVALAFVSFGGSEAAAKAGGKGVSEFLSHSFAQFTAKLGVEAGSRITVRAVRQAGGKMLKKIMFQTAGVLTATELAHLSVIKHMNGINNGLATDAVLADQVDMGGNLYAQETCKKQLMCKPLAPDELRDAKIADAQYLRDTQMQKNIKQRYIAVDDPSSLSGKFISSLNKTFSNPSDRLGTYIASLTTSIASVPTRLFSVITSGRVLADANNISGAGDYNIVQWGYTEEEENLIENNTDYSIIDNQLILESSGKIEEIEENYKKCWEETSGTLLSKGLIQREEEGAVIAGEGDCSPMNLGLHNPKYGDLVFRWRLNQRNQNTINHLIEMQEAMDN
ncbi:hypothetical protein KDA11_00705, partial [Candidatus Saccharibacteria bacterium]|nr:hypothetical protein [Candidatus Saccharibacteria bacterium]